jgi:hypothetical protein
MSVRARSGAQCIRTAGHQSQHQQLQHTSVPLFLILSSFLMRQTQSTAVEGEDGPLVDFPLPPISLLSVRYNELHPYPTPARDFPLSSPYFSFTLIQNSWDLFCFTLAPHIPDFRPTFLSTSLELCSATPPARVRSPPSSSYTHMPAYAIYLGERPRPAF